MCHLSGHQAYNFIRTKFGLPIVDKSLNPSCASRLTWRHKAAPKSKKRQGRVKGIQLKDVEDKEILEEVHIDKGTSTSLRTKESFGSKWWLTERVESSGVS